MDNYFNDIQSRYMIIPKCINNKWVVYVCDIKEHILKRYCTFTDRSSAKKDDFNKFMKGVSGKEWRKIDIDKSGGVYLGHQTAYYIINYITLLLQTKIDFNTKAKYLPRVDFAALIKEMNEVISVF